MKLSKELAACRIAGPLRLHHFPLFEFRLLVLYLKRYRVTFVLFIICLSQRVARLTMALLLRIRVYGMPQLPMQYAGPSCFLAKTNIKSAFRIIPIHPNDYPLLGMKWRGRFYYDRCMPMGCSSSCKTFETFSTAVEWIARHKQKIDKILHLLDDFLFVSSSHTQWQTYLYLFLALCNHIGIPLAPENTCGPATTLSFAAVLN